MPLNIHEKHANCSRASCDPRIVIQSNHRRKSRFTLLAHASVCAYYSTAEWLFSMSLPKRRCRPSVNWQCRWSMCNTIWIHYTSSAVWIKLPSSASSRKHKLRFIWRQKKYSCTRPLWYFAITTTLYMKIFSIMKNILKFLSPSNNFQNNDDKIKHKFSCNFTNYLKISFYWQSIS